MAFQDIEIDGIDEEDVEDDLESIYDPKSEFKRPVLASEAVRACRESRAREMKKGFWNTKLDKEGNAIRTWQEDQRRVFINSVIALENLLAAEADKDDIYKKFRFGEDGKTGIEEKIKKAFEKFAYSVFVYDSKTGGWKKTGDKFIPQIEEELLIPSPNDPKVLVNVKGGWDFKINAYYDELVSIYDEIFRELNKVIFRANDFGQKFSY